MTGGDPKDRARAQVAELVKRFKHNEADHLRSTYNETQARTEFITPLLEAFGWDVHNMAGHPLTFREVIEEATVEVGDERLSKRPDYELRLARQRKLFVEAKKPSVRIDKERAPAFQTRRYGYSASLPISVVTNFHQLAVYDCQPVPTETDEAHVARLCLVGYEEFEERFDELWLLLSREAVYSGNFDRHFAIDATRHGAEQFDDYFLSQVRDWRERLAVDIHANTPGLTSEELTYAVQLFLSRIVFLRICEDREIEKYETLKNLGGSATFDALMEVLRRADEFYDSGLFSLLDDERLGIRISDATLSSIISELYYPQSPYTFAVVETEVLGEIYEQFLGEVITVGGGAVEIVSKPEVRESGGVVPTPSFIADTIVERTIGPAIAGKSPQELEGFTVADTCCGSGIFLLSSYDFMLGHYLDWYVSHDPQAHAGREIYEAGAGQWKLTFGEKRRILLGHLRGVDIDPNAVEVAQFSLLLKLIEDESEAALKDYVTTHKHPALPSLSGTIRCGNSLVSTSEWQIACGEMPGEVRDKVNPFSWEEEFPAEMVSGGFDVVVGNPPYVRIQNMVAFSPEEIAYYHAENSPYTTARQDNYDKYALFIERSLALAKNGGRIGVIVPHKFMTIQAGRALRSLLGGKSVLREIVHFGVKQVFGRGTANYTCILILDCAGSQSVAVEKAGPLEAWRYGQKGPVTTYDTDAFGEAPWEFADEEVRALFERIRATYPERLSAVADVEVGVQTSADKIYIVRETASDADTITFRWDNQDWRLERDILRPCLLDAPLYAYTRPEANAWMIFPYELIANENGRTRARLIQPGEMADRYPLCWAYLNARREDLERRNIVGGSADERQWYQYGRSQSLTKFDRPKIILPVLSVEPRYAFDETNILFTGGGNGPYYMIRAKGDGPVSTLYLLAVLNHPLCEAMIRTNTSPFRGGYYSHGKQFIQSLPVPIPDDAHRAEIEALARRVVTATDELAAARTPHEIRRRERALADMRTRLERRIGEIFNLSETDWDTVKSVPIPE
ncbi:N-6 DNA methylase [Altererythrobacter marinus]|uniref:site-specific DNA-methyltransferase (adenine-specific) n=1 Tax=Pelagerythrobacter marinus TaxID=538382 RepID=A0ABW9UW24_9SPHN|nr:N-6 DNA methylase [Pelagerythrobacter marinus]